MPHRPLAEPRPMPWRACLALVMALACTAPWSARAEVTRIGDWLVGCNNLGRCTAWGIPGSATPGAGPAWFAISITSAASMPATPEVEVVALGAQRDRPSGLLVGPDGVIPVAPQGGRRQLDQEQAVIWLRRLQAGAVIASRGDIPQAWPSLSAEGFAAVWQVLTRPRTARPVAARPRIAQAVELIVSGHPPIAITRFSCPAGAERGALRRFAWPSHGTDLWSVTCNGPDGPRLHWLYQPRGGPLAALRLPDGGGPAIEGGLADSGFEFDFGILRARIGPAGRDDCGIQRAWAFDGQGWFLLERREMPVCVGLNPPDWIATYSRP